MARVEASKMRGKLLIGSAEEKWVTAVLTYVSVPSANAETYGRTTRRVARVFRNPGDSKSDAPFHLTFCIRLRAFDRMQE